MAIFWPGRYLFRAFSDHAAFFCTRIFRSMTYSKDWVDLQLQYIDNNSHGIAESYKMEAKTKGGLNPLQSKTGQYGISSL